MRTKKLAVELPDVPAKQLRDELRKQHVQLEHPMPAELREYLANGPIPALGADAGKVAAVAAKTNRLPQDVKIGEIL